MRHWRIGIWSLWLAACGGNPSAPDAGAPPSPPDAAESPVDAAATIADASPPPDVSSPDATLGAQADASEPDALAPPDAAPPDAAMADASLPDATLPDAATPDATTDPCMGIPVGGVCSTSGSIDLCVQPELGDPYLETFFCQPDELCAPTATGAECVLAVECRENDTQCADASHLRVCVNGHWVTSSCPRQCLGTPLGDFCGLNESTRSLAATLQYQYRLPNDTLTGWGPLQLWPARGFLVLSVRAFSDGTIVPIDAVFTSGGAAAGQLSILVASTPQPGDLILVLAARPSGDQQLAFALADPRMVPGTYPTGVHGADPALWFWGWAVNKVAPGATLTITETMGSGAASVFDLMRFVYEDTLVRWPGRPRWRLIAWLGDGVRWECGTCFSQRLTVELDTIFGSQLWLNGGSDAEWWADSVTAHELGHWAMASYGHPVGEGGPHIFGVPTTPGLAWSEGWATWFSSDLRGSPVYFDKQNGTAFWFDLSYRAASNGLWPRPNASYDLYQDIYENEISAMMWSLSSTQGLGSARLDAALSGPRMTRWPFLRGYATPYGLNTTFFGDFLDALVCDGLAPGIVDAATEPRAFYPYPSANPLCLAPRPPATLHLERTYGEPAPGRRLGLRAQLRRADAWPHPVTIAIETPAGPTILRRVVGADVADVDLQLADVPAEDLVVIAASRGPGGGFHAEARYRFGRPEPVRMAPRRAGPRLKIVSGGLIP